METSSKTPAPGESQLALPPIEEQRDLAERMAVAERIARVIAHDLNNVFQALLVNLQFAENGAQNSPAVLSDIRDASQTTERALALAKRLQMFTRSHSLTLTSIDLGEWLGRHRDHLSKRAGHALAIGIRETPDLCMVRADGVALLQALEKIVDNAIEAMPEGGTLLLGAQPVNIPAEYSAEHPYHPPARMVMIEVRDSGPGIDAEVARHVFEPYFSARKDSRESGIGLSLVYAAVRKMGGFMQMDSKPGEGTTIRLFIPAASLTYGEDHQAEAEGASELQIPTSNEGDSLPPVRGILIVETDPIVREVASRCLAREGYPIFEAVDGEGAIELYERYGDEIGLVMLEFALPHRTGLEVQAAIRAKSPQQRFLFCSSFNSDLRIDAIAEDPRIQLIPKPFTRADLLNTVELMIGRP